MYNLPLEIIYHILSYNRHFLIKNGKLITINRLNMSKYLDLVISPRKYLKQFPLDTSIYGFYIQFKNKRLRLYYRETEEIEVIFEAVSKNSQHYLVEWHSYYIE